MVVLVAAVLGLSAATLGVDWVQGRLISDAVATAGDANLDTVEQIVRSGVEEDGLEFFDFFVDSVFRYYEPRLADTSLGRLRADALNDLLKVADPDDDGRIDVLTNYGSIVDIRLVEDAAPRSDPMVLGGPIVPTATLEALVFHVDGSDAEQPDLRFLVRSLGGIDYVGVAEVGDVVRAVDSIRAFVWIGVPVMVSVVGLITWLLTGRALRPVSDITGRVSEISARTLNERVPVPSTDDEISKLALTMNQMLDRLEADDVRLRRFVADVSHELRSPVAVLRSEAEVALREPSAIGTAELAEGVLDESLRLQRIVEELLILARGEEVTAAGSTLIDVDDVVLAQAARGWRVPVDTASVSAGRVWGSEVSLARVVAHLIDNAARHASSRVWIGLRTDDDHVLLWVDDDGTGVPEAERERVFDRFVRLDESRARDVGGAGLGLAVVAETVATGRGTVEVRDASAGGARFIVRWPRVDHAEGGCDEGSHDPVGHDQDGGVGSGIAES